VALGFLDLMAVRFVDAFIEAGLSLHKIRQAAKRRSAGGTRARYRNPKVFAFR
jgi:hypothetical protein